MWRKRNGLEKSFCSRKPFPERRREGRLGKRSVPLNISKYMRKLLSIVMRCVLALCVIRIALDEAKKIAEERRREKMEDRLARQRVKEQIAKDRADREAKPPEKTSLSQPTTAAPQQAASAPKKHSTCRLQVSFLLDHGM